MATWAKGIDFKNSGNTARIGGIGVYGNDSTAQKLYIGLGAEPWNNAGLQLTSSAINFKGNKIYHAGDKPTLSELGAAASSHTHSYLPLSGGTLTGETVFNNYLSLNAWSGYGSGRAQLWYNGTNKQLVIQPTAVTDIIVNNNKVYHAGNKPTPAEIGAAASSHTHNYAGSSSAGGAATTALTSNYLGSNTRMEYGWNGVNYFNISGTAGNAAKANDTPSTAWWHIMRFNHANNTGYYTDLAIPFNDTSLYYKRITAGSVQNGGWVKVLDSLNYNSYAPTKTGGGASGTWGISVTGNSATATKLQTPRNIQIGNTSKQVDGSKDVSWNLSEIGAAAASHNHTSLTGVTSIGGAGASSSWGSLNIAGSKGGWAGIHFSDTKYVFLVNNEGHCGIWKDAGNAIYSFDKNGALVNGTVGWDKITGKPSTYAPSSHNHTALIGTNDTRSKEYTPATCPTDTKVTFQSNGTNGVNDGGNFYSLMHIPRWSHNSGGYGSQFAFTDNGNVWYRKGTSDTAWSEWRRIWHSGNFDPNTKFQSGGTYGTVYLTDWFRAKGNTGLYFQDWGGGWYMIDSTWIRAYNGKNIYTEGVMNSKNGFQWNGQSLDSRYAASSHSHSYLPLSGGTMTGDLRIAKSNAQITFNGKDTNYYQIAHSSANGTLVFNYNGKSLFTVQNNGDIIPTTNKDMSIGDYNFKLKSITSEDFSTSSAKIIPTAHPNTIQVQGTKDSGIGAIKLGTGGCRIYGTNTATRLFVEGGIYTNLLIECGDQIIANGSVYPGRNAQGGWDCGLANRRFYTVYCVNVNQSSDRNMKEDIHYIDNEIALLSTESENPTPFKDFICNDLKVATYKYKRQITIENEDGTSEVEDIEHEPQDSQIGFIAQDIRDTEIGSMFVYGEDGNMNYSPSGFTTVVAKALQEEIKTRDLEIEALKNRLKILEEKLGLQ